MPVAAPAIPVAEIEMPHQAGKHHDTTQYQQWFLRPVVNLYARIAFDRSQRYFISFNFQRLPPASSTQ